MLIGNAVYSICFSQLTEPSFAGELTLCRSLRNESVFSFGDRRVGLPPCECIRIASADTDFCRDACESAIWPCRDAISPLLWRCPTFSRSALRWRLLDTESV